MTPPILPILGRVGVLLLSLVVAAVIAFTWFSSGISWVFDAPLLYSPFLECPGFIINTNGEYPNGPLCKLSLTYTFDHATALQSEGLLTTRANEVEIGRCSLSASSLPEQIYCYWGDACDNICRDATAGGRCVHGGDLLNTDQCVVTLGAAELPQAETLCYTLSAESYCDSSFKVTPSNEIAMRGIAIATLVIVLLWAVAELVLRSVDAAIKSALSKGRAAQSESLMAKTRELRALVEAQWTTWQPRQLRRVDTSPDDIASLREETGSVRSVAASVRSNRSVNTQNSGRVRSSSPCPSPMALKTMPRQLFPVTPRKDRPDAVGRQTSLTLGSTFSSPLNVHGYFGPHSAIGAAAPVDANRVFSGSDWQRRVGRYHKLRTERKSEFKTREFMRSLSLAVAYFGLIIVTVYVVLVASPHHISTPAGSITDVLAGSASVWEIHSVLDLIIFADILLDFGLFLVAALAVQWPKPPVFSRHLMGKRDPLVRPVSADSRQWVDDDELSESSLVELGGESALIGSSVDTQSLSFVLKQSLSMDCCLMIACHESTMTSEKSEAFSATLRAALAVFPPRHIFICDNGSSSSPVDDTQMVARAIHPDINYLYVPEGNKTFAFYWCNKYWVPFLSRCGIVEESITYALIIDDDVPLPSDLHIPHEHLRQHPEIKAVHFPITATTPNGSPGLLVRCQDIEYKLAGLHKQFQSKLSRCLSCHGAIALWEREAMDQVFFSHDTVFHGEDMYMGLCLLRRRDNARIVSAAQTIVPTFAPDSWGVLFRQRVKSWELTSHRKTVTYVRELLSPASFCHGPSLALKPYFLQEVVTILLDWLRVYLLCGLLLRDWLGLVLMTALFSTLMYIQVTIFTLFVLRSRPELRPSILTIIGFPVYRLCGLVFRVCALCHNLLVYSYDRGGVKIGKREDEIKDIPPLPPIPIVDWFTVWIPKKH